MNNKKTHIIKGVIISVFIIILNIYVIISKQLTNPTLGILPYIVTIVGLIISGILYSRENNGNVNFGNIFGYCFRIVAIIVIIYFFWTILSMKIIFPNQLDTMLAENKIQMQKDGIAPKEIERRLQLSRDNGVTMRNSANIFLFAIIGAIGSLLGAVFARKNEDATKPLEKA